MNTNPFDIGYLTVALWDIDHCFYGRGYRHLTDGREFSVAVEIRTHYEYVEVLPKHMWGTLMLTSIPNTIFQKLLFGHARKFGYRLRRIGLLKSQEYITGSTPEAVFHILGLHPVPHWEWVAGYGDYLQTEKTKWRK